jgi:hypothetical protein
MRRRCGCGAAAAFGPHPSLQTETAMNKKYEEHFWDIDLVVLFKDWFSQIGLFLLMAVTFIGIGLPLFISILVLWYLAGFPSFSF